MTLLKASRSSFALTPKAGGSRSLIALQTSGGHARASFGVDRRFSVSNEIAPRSGGPNRVQKRSGPMRTKAATIATKRSAATAAIPNQIFIVTPWVSQIRVFPPACLGSSGALFVLPVANQGVYPISFDGAWL